MKNTRPIEIQVRSHWTQAFTTMFVIRVTDTLIIAEDAAGFENRFRKSDGTIEGSSIRTNPYTITKASMESFKAKRF